MATDDREARWWDAVEEATELLNEGAREDAAQVLAGVCAEDPENPYAPFLLAGIRFEEGAFDEAVRLYGDTLRLAPHHAGARVGRGHALRMLGRLDESVADGRALLAMPGFAEDGDAHYLLALAEAARGHKSEAAEHLRAFLASNPELEARQDAEGLLDLMEGRGTPEA